MLNWKQAENGAQLDFLLPPYWKHGKNTNLLGHAPGLGYELSDPHDVGGDVVDRLLLLNHLQLVQQLRNENIQVLHYELHQMRTTQTIITWKGAGNPTNCIYLKLSGSFPEDLKTCVGLNLLLLQKWQPVRKQLWRTPCSSCFWPTPPPCCWWGWWFQEPLLSGWGSH